jgi:hypothetical protein
MKLLLAAFLPLASAFVPSTKHVTKTELAAIMTRRDALLAASGMVVGAFAPIANAGTANPFLEEEINFEPSQQARSDKIDINGAFVVRSITI